MTPAEQRLDSAETAMKGIAIVILGVGGAMQYFHDKNGKEVKPVHPEGEFEVMNLDSSHATLRQDGVDYIVNTVDLSEEVKLKLANLNPELKKFLDDGPIKVFTPDGKKEEVNYSSGPDYPYNPSNYDSGSDQSYTPSEQK